MAEGMARGGILPLGNRVMAEVGSGPEYFIPPGVHLRTSREMLRRLLDEGEASDE